MHWLSIFDPFTLFLGSVLFFINIRLIYVMLKNWDVNRGKAIVDFICLLGFNWLTLWTVLELFSMHGFSVYDPSILLIGSLFIFANVGYIYMTLKCWDTKRAASKVFLICFAYIDLLTLHGVLHVIKNF